MAEEVKIVVKEERQGTALKDATADAKKLADAQKTAPAPPPAPAAAPAKPSVPTPASPERIAEIRKARAESYAMERAAEARREAANARAAAFNSTPMEGEGGKKEDDKDAKVADEQAKIDAMLERKAKQDAAHRDMLKNQAAAGAQRLAEEEALAAAKGVQVQMDRAQITAQEALAAFEGERLAEEKAITEEKLKQSALAKLALKTGVQGIAGQVGGGTGSLAGMAAMGPQLAAVAAIAAVIGEAIGTSISQAADVAKSGQESAQARGRLRTIGGKSGGIGEQAAAQNAQQMASELEDALAKKGTFRNTSPIGDSVKGVLKLFGVNAETSKDKAERENDLRIQQLQRDSPASAAQALKKAQEGTSGLEVRKTEEELQGHLGVARAIQFKIDRQKEYEAALRAVGAVDEQSATAAQKKESAHRADVKVMGEWRDEAMKFGSLVNARSGARDIAMAASAAQRFMKDGGIGDASAKLGEIHETMKSQHEVVMNATRTKFGRGS
jgi:hypothetical protein